jgi:hypothetical protein
MKLNNNTTFSFENFDLAQLNKYPLGKLNLVIIREAFKKQPTIKALTEICTTEIEKQWPRNKISGIKSIGEKVYDAEPCMVKFNFDSAFSIILSQSAWCWDPSPGYFSGGGIIFPGIINEEDELFSIQLGKGDLIIIPATPYHVWYKEQTTSGIVTLLHYESIP